MSISLTATEAYKRLQLLFDDGVFTELDSLMSTSVICGYGTVNGVEAYAFSENINDGNGGIDAAHCKKTEKLYTLAAKTGRPVVGIYDSEGLSLTEPYEAMGAYGEVLKAAADLSGVVPQLALIAGTCVGTSALMAGLADVVVCTEYADYYITAPSAVSAKENAAAGTVDVLADSIETAVDSVRSVLSLLPENNLSPVPETLYDAPVSADYGTVAAIADEGSAVFLKEAYAPETVTTLATVGGKTIGLISLGSQAVTPAAAYKAEALVRLCDAYQIPIITLADTVGYEKGRETALLSAMTRLTSAYTAATTPKISLITAQSVGGAYIAFAGKSANADITLAWNTAVVSPLTTEAAVAFPFGKRLADGENRAAVEEEYKTEHACTERAAECGQVDAVIAPEETRAQLIAVLELLSSKRETTLPRKHTVK